MKEQIGSETQNLRGDSVVVVPYLRSTAKRISEGVKNHDNSKADQFHPINRVLRSRFKLLEKVSEVKDRNVRTTKRRQAKIQLESESRRSQEFNTNREKIRPVKKGKTTPVSEAKDRNRNSRTTQRRQKVKLGSSKIQELHNQGKLHLVRKGKKTTPVKGRNIRITKSRQVKDNLGSRKSQEFRKCRDPQPSRKRKLSKENIKYIPSPSMSSTSSDSNELSYLKRKQRQRRSKKLTSEQTRLLRQHIDDIVGSSDSDEEMEVSQTTLSQNTYQLSQRRGRRFIRKNPHPSQSQPLSGTEPSQSQRISTYDDILRTIFSNPSNQNEPQKPSEKNGNPENSELHPSSSIITLDSSETNL